MSNLNLWFLDQEIIAEDFDNSESSSKQQFKQA